MGYETWFGLVSWKVGKSMDEFVNKGVEMEAGDICICDEDICGGRKRAEDGVCDVRDEMEAAVDGFLAED